MDSSKPENHSYYRKRHNGFILETNHEQPLNDCCLDYYSRRLASCSSDNLVKIYDVNASEKPVMVAELKDHTSAVWKVSWSHPRYGSLLATCSYDKSVFIYKETSLYKYEIIYMNMEHKSSVNYVEWAPHEFGLHLGCGSSDGYLSIISYLPMKELTNEGYWHRYAFKTHLNGVSCLSWEQSSNSILSNKSLNLNETSEVMNSLKIVTGGFDNQVIIWTFDNVSKELHKIYQMNDKPHNAAIRDVAWKPSVNNASNIIASCSEDNTLILWIEDLSNNRWKHGQTIKFDCKVFRIHWAYNGAVFAVAGENESVFVFKENAEGIWERVCSFTEKDVWDHKHDEDLDSLSHSISGRNNVQNQQTNHMNNVHGNNSNVNMSYEQPISQNNTARMQSVQGSRMSQPTYQMNMNNQGTSTQMNLPPPPIPPTTTTNTTTTTTNTPMPGTAQTNAFTNNQNAQYESSTYGMNSNQNRNTGVVPPSMSSYQPPITSRPPPPPPPPAPANIVQSVGYPPNNSASSSSPYQNTTTTPNTIGGVSRMGLDHSAMPPQDPLNRNMNASTDANNNNNSAYNPSNYSSKIQMTPPIPATTSSVSSVNMNNANTGIIKPSFTSYANTNNTSMMPPPNPVTTNRNVGSVNMTATPTAIGNSTSSVNTMTPMQPPRAPTNVPVPTYANSQMVGQFTPNDMYMNTHQPNNQTSIYPKIPNPPMPPSSHNRNPQ